MRVIRSQAKNRTASTRARYGKWPTRFANTTFGRPIVAVDAVVELSCHLLPLPSGMR
jgi:hypothetical protein